MSKKLKNLLYNNKSEFEKDLNQIWTNCLTYNTIPDSIYRKHAFAMKKRATELLANVPDVHVQGNGEDSESDEDSKAEGPSKAISACASLIDLAAAHQTGDQPTPVVQEMEISDKESENDVEQELNEAVEKEKELKLEQERIKNELCVDENLLDEQYKKVVLNALIKIQRDRLEKLKTGFSDQKSLVRTDEGVANFIVDQQRYLKRNQLRREFFKNGEAAKQKIVPDQLFSLYNLPELSHFAASIPMPSVKVPRFPGDLAEFYLDEYDASPYIPVPPNPTMSEYRQFQPDMESRLNQAIVKNIASYASIKDTYFKILAKQVIHLM